MVYTEVPRKVLIVEDSPQMAANLEIALTAVDDVEVRVAESAVEALGVLEQGDAPDFAAIVTDLEMPHMTGFELIERLRRNPRYHSTPIIVSSGSTDPDSPAKALRLGANAYFSKPYSPSELRKKLQRLLEENQDRRPRDT
ncbi:MAG: response regulator [Bryobacteraceae bacterium]